MRVPFRRSGQKDDAESFEALVIPHLDSLYRFACRLTGSPSMAEDLVHSLIANLLPQISKLRDVKSLGPWLSRSLYNLYVDSTRRKRTSPIDLMTPESDQVSLDELADESVDSPESFAERCCTHEQIAEALQRLTPELRAVVIWHDMEGYKMEEIAQALSIPVGTVKSRLHRSRGMLRELLIERFPMPLRDSE